MLGTPIWNNHNLFRFWMWCLLKASYTDRVVSIGYQDVPLKPGQFIFGRHTAAQETGLSERTIRTSIDQLRKRQNIAIKTTNKFSVISIVNWAAYQEEVTSKTTSKRPANDQQTTTNNKDNKDNKGNKGTNVLFENFWKEYPRKTGKGNAVKAYDKAVENRDNGSTPAQFTDMLIEAIKVVKKTEQWHKDNGQFIPHPTTWLNGQRWLDEANTTSGKQRRIL